MTDAYHRRVIKITAEDSPNVRRALDEMNCATWEEYVAKKAANPALKPSNVRLVPGVMSWDSYKFARENWDAERQCWGLDGMFYEGAEVMLFPALVLTYAARYARWLDRNAPNRKAKAMGIDPGEGAEDTTWSIVDESGLIHQEGEKTPDTSVIRGKTLHLADRYQLAPEQIMFDRGGGGYQIANDMRADGYPVRTVGFGESPTLELKRGITRLEERKESKEEQYAYMNRRAEMYGGLSLFCELRGHGAEAKPVRGDGFGIPGKYEELHRQLSLIPKTYDKEGRLKLPPKNKNTANSNERTLTEILGHSPNDADSLVIALHCLLHKARRSRAGVPA